VTNVADCLKALGGVSANGSLNKIGEALAKIQETYSDGWPYGKIGEVRKQIEDFFSDAAFLQSLLPGADGEDPLAQDWEWSRGHMLTLLKLTREFGESFDEAKREAGGVDFADHQPRGRGGEPVPGGRCEAKHLPISAGGSENFPTL